MLPTTHPVTPIQHAKAEAPAYASPALNADPSRSIVALFILSPEKAERLISVLKELLCGAEGLNPMGLTTLPITTNADTSTAWLTHPEAARFLGISTATLYRYAEQERIEFRKIGNRLEYRRSALDQFKEQQIRPPRSRRQEL